MTTDTNLLYLSRRDVEAAQVPMADVIAALHSAYTEKGHGRTEAPAKIGIHTRPDALLHAMPGYIPALTAAGLKWIGAYPENPARGRPQVAGLIVLNDVETGLPTCIMDAGWVTAMRTGAKTALAARYLARPDARTVGIVACGVQGRSNLEALALEFEIERVHAFDVRRDVAERYAAEMSRRLGLDVRVVGTPEEAVRDMDIVVTSGPIRKHPTPVIEDDWLAPGAFAAPVDFDSYWKGEVLQAVDRFSTDDVEQLFYYQKVGYFQTLPPRERVLDLGEVAAGKVPARESRIERTLSMNLGLALDDVAVAPLVYRAAVAKGLGVPLER